MDTRIILFALWIVVMLIYLLGDVLRIFSGDYQAGEMGQQLVKFTQAHWLMIAILMVTPIVMIFLTLVLPQPVSRWSNISVGGFFLLFNLVGLPTYPSLYDKFLLVVSIVFNVLTIWYAWNWV
jgi:hypothetical protein